MMSFSTLTAAEKTNSPNISLGFGITGGYSSAWQHTGDGEWGIGYNYGGGIIVEKMFTNLLGIHSGLWFTESRDELKMDGVKMDTILRTLTFPLYLIVSVNKGIFSLNYLVGINVSQIIDCYIYNNEKSTENKSAYVLNYISPYQLGIATGLNLKFRVSKHVDYFLGIIGEFYGTNFWRTNDHWNDYGHIYNARMQMGVLFRTNIFPIPEK